MGQLVGEGFQIRYNGKLVSQLASDTRCRVHWLPQDRVKMQQWLYEQRHTETSLKTVNDNSLKGLALSIGLDFDRLDTEQKAVMKAKMKSSLTYTIKTLKASGRVTERWDPRAGKVVIDWPKNLIQDLCMGQLIDLKAEDSRSPRDMVELGQNALLEKKTDTNAGIEMRNTAASSVSPDLQKKTQQSTHFGVRHWIVQDQGDFDQTEINEAINRSLHDQNTSRHEQHQRPYLESLQGLDLERSSSLEQLCQLYPSLPTPPVDVDTSMVISLEAATAKFYEQKGYLDQFERYLVIMKNDLTSKSSKDKEACESAKKQLAIERKALRDREVTIKRAEQQARLKEQRLDQKRKILEARAAALKVTREPEMVERKKWGALESDSTRAHRIWVANLTSNIKVNPQQQMPSSIQKTSLANNAASKPVLPPTCNTRRRRFVRSPVAELHLDHDHVWWLPIPWKAVLLVFVLVFLFLLFTLPTHAEPSPDGWVGN